MSTAAEPTSGTAPAADVVAPALEGTEYHSLVPRDGMRAVRVERQAVHEALSRLKQAGFETCTLVTAIDRHPQAPRFEVVWQLLSVQHNERVRVVVPVPESDPSVPSSIDLWPGAAFAERECFDMFGIKFDGHEGLKRLLLPEGYDHHPLRKDFPHQGIQPDRLYREWDAERREGWDEDA